jgi:hypothetical protein
VGWPRGEATPESIATSKTAVYVLHLFTQMGVDINS